MSVVLMDLGEGDQNQERPDLVLRAPDAPLVACFPSEVLLALSLEEIPEHFALDMRMHVCGCSGCRFETVYQRGRYKADKIA